MVDLAADKAEADQLATELLTRAGRMLAALDAAGLNPFTDPKNLIVLQLLGPVSARIVGADPSESMPQLIGIAADLDLTVLQGFLRG